MCRACQGRVIGSGEVPRARRGWRVSVCRGCFSHSSRDSRQAMAVQRWPVEQEPGLAEEILWIWTRTPGSGRGNAGSRRCNRRTPAVRR